MFGNDRKRLHDIENKLSEVNYDNKMLVENYRELIIKINDLTRGIKAMQICLELMLKYMNLKYVHAKTNEPYLEDIL